MNLYFRVFFLIIKRIFRPKKIDIFDSCSTEFLVNPMDLDINFHMNNGRYLSIMDLGRVDLMIRAGVFWKLISGGYYPVVKSESIRFKKSLELMQKFELVTLVESWDEKDFYITQKFLVKGEMVAEGYIKGRFRKRGQKHSVSTPELFKILGKSYGESKLSELAKAQDSVENNLCQ